MHLIISLFLPILLFFLPSETNALPTLHHAYKRNDHDDDENGSDTGSDLDLKLGIGLPFGMIAALFLLYICLQNRYLKKQWAEEERDAASSRANFTATNTTYEGVRPGRDVEGGLEMRDVERRYDSGGKEGDQIALVGSASSRKGSVVSVASVSSVEQGANAGAQVQAGRGSIGNGAVAGVEGRGGEKR